MAAHGNIYRSGDNPPTSKFYDQGKFGRLFGNLPAFSLDTPSMRAQLRKLGALAGPMDAKDPLIKDPKELSKLNSALAQPNIEKMTEYSRRLYDLVTAMQKDITAVMESQYSSFTKTATGAIEKTTAASPIGGDIFSAAMQQMLDASNKAYGNMTQMAKQMSDIADANTKSATSATSRAAAAAKKK